MKVIEGRERSGREREKKKSEGRQKGMERER